MKHASSGDTPPLNTPLSYLPLPLLIPLDLAAVKQFTEYWQSTRGSPFPASFPCSLRLLSPTSCSYINYNIFWHVCVCVCGVMAWPNVCVCVCSIAYNFNLICQIVWPTAVAHTPCELQLHLAHSHSPSPSYSPSLPIPIAIVIVVIAIVILMLLCCNCCRCRCCCCGCCCWVPPFIEFASLLANN